MAAKLYQDQVLNHMWEFPDDATPEEMDGFVAKHHARAGEHLAKQGWGRELFQAAQPLVQQAVGGGATQGSALAPYGADDVFGLGTQQVTQLQQNFQQDQVHQQRSAADERAMLMQQEEQEKDRSLRLKVLQQKEKNDKIEADLNSRRVVIAEKQVAQDETQMNRGQLVTGPDGGMYQMTFDQAGNPIVGSTPVLPAPAQTISAGGDLWEKSGDGWRKVAGYGPQSSGGGTTPEKPAYRWSQSALASVISSVEEIFSPLNWKEALAADGMNAEDIAKVAFPSNLAGEWVARMAQQGYSPEDILVEAHNQMDERQRMVSEEQARRKTQSQTQSGTNPTAPAPTMVLPDISTQKQGEVGRFLENGQKVEFDKSGKKYLVIDGVGAVDIRSLNPQKPPMQPNVPFSPGGYMPPQ